MTDRYDGVLMQTTAQRRINPKMQAVLADMMAEEAPQAAPAVAAVPAQKPVVPPVKAPEGPGFWKEAKRAVVGGIRDAVNQSLNALDQGATWLNNNVIDTRDGSPTKWAVGSANIKQQGPQLQNAIPETAANETAGGKIARGIVQFAAPFTAISKAMAVPQMGRVAHSLAAGAVTDSIVFDPHEARLSNLLVEQGKGNPLLDNAVTRFLAASPDDSNAVGRLKNVLEGAGLGLAVDGVFKGISKLRDSFQAKGLKPDEALKKAAAQAEPSAVVPPTTSPLASQKGTLAEQIERLTGVDRAAGPAAEARRAQKYLDMKAALREPGATGRAAPQDKAALLHEEPVPKPEAGPVEAGLPPSSEALDPNAPALLQARRSQAGGADPALLGNVAGAGLGAVAGVSSAEDDATFGDRLFSGVLGAAAGFAGGKKLGNLLERGAKGADEAAVAASHQAEEFHPVVQDLARPEVRNIAPLPAAVKKAPFISTGKAREFVELARNGGLEDLAGKVKESDFNFDHIDTADDVKSMIDGFSAHFEKETTLATGGVQSHAATARYAQEIGTSVKQLEQLYGATGNLAARVHAGRILLAASAEKTNSMIRRVLQEGSASDILAFRKQVATHAAIQAQMKGVQTEVARALNQFRMQASSVDMAIHEKNAILEALGGRDANVRFAELLDGISDPVKRNKVARLGAAARTPERLWWAWMQGLLSGPATHVANAIGNTAVAAIAPIERAIGSMISNLPGGSREIQHGEALEQMAGMVGGMVDALRITAQGREAIKDAAGQFIKGDFTGASNTLSANGGEFGNAIRSFNEDRGILGATEGAYEHSARPISADALELDPTTLMGRMADVGGAVIGMPTRALQASDELFRTMHYRGELRSLAFREGRRQGLKGDDLAQFVADTLERPPADFHAQAIEAARQGTFQAPLGQFGRWLQEGTLKVPALRFIMPFVRTPINILKYAGHRTPGLAQFSAQVQADMAAGGARREMAIARQVFGGAMLTVAALAAHEGLLTGGGEKDQTAEKLAGWQPYSAKIGGEYVSLARIEPFGTLFGLAADFVDISGHLDEQTSSEVAASIGLALTRNFTSKSYVQGLSRFLAAVVDPAQKGANWFEQFAASFVPGIANTVRKAMDDDVKEVRGLLDAVKARLPGFSKDVPAQVDLFGRDIKLKGGWGPDLLSPVMVSPESDDPASKELMRLNLDMKGPGKTLPGHGGGPGIDLDPQQYRRYRQLAGNEFKIGGKGFHEALNELVQSEAYQALPETDQNDYIQPRERRIKLLQAQYQRGALQALLQEDPELARAVQTSKSNAAKARSGQAIEDPWWEQ